MKYTNLLAVLAIAFGTTIASAEEYTTGCTYEISGDRTTYKLRTLEDETIVEFKSDQDITPQECLNKAVTALKQTYPSSYLAGGQLRKSSYFNKTATIQVTHKDNVDFPKQQLEIAIVTDASLHLHNGFAFVESWLSDNYYEAKVGVKK